MTDLVDIVESVFPSDQSVGVNLTNRVVILFNREMDESCLQDSIYIEGPDSDEVIHNSYLPTELKAGTEDSLLESPGYTGIVPGTYQFERIDPTTGLVVTTLDTLGTGTLYKTRLTFIPTKPFAPDTEYRVHIVGDEDLSDSEDFGSKSRSVFDTVATGGNTSTGTPVIAGTYTGTVSTDTVNLRVTASGVLGKAEFEWWLDSVPYDLHGPGLTHVNTLNFIKGTTVRFEEGLYQVGDEWTSVLKRPAYYEGHLEFKFTTGGGTISPVSGETATSPTGDPLPSSVASLGSFLVTKTTPVDMDAGLTADKYDQIVIEFNKDVDPATVTNDSVQVIATPVTDHPNISITSANGPIAKILTVNGNKIYIDV